MEKELIKGKVPIITGASYGMGQTMAELFAEEGAAVVLTARGQEKLDQVVEGIRAKGGRTVGVVADVCSTQDTRRVFETALQEFGDVDILIDNAGIGEQKMIDETDDDWMLYVMNTNLGGPMRYIREELKIFMPKNDGHHQHFLCQRRAALLRGDLHVHPGSAEHPNQECGHAADRYQHPVQRGGPRCDSYTGPHRKQSRGAARRRKDAGAQWTFCVLPRPGVRSHGSGVCLLIPCQQNGASCQRAGNPSM